VKETEIYFPIAEPGKTLNRKALDGIPLPPQLKTWIEAIQPNDATKRSPGSPEDVIASALCDINKFARLDRHRKPHLIASVLSDETSLIRCSPPAEIIGVQRLRANPLEGQYEIAAFQIDGLTTSTEFYIDTQFTLDIRIDGAPEDMSFLAWLPHLKDQAFRVIQRFDDAFR
jgi:hypothetical protein